MLVLRSSPASPFGRKVKIAAHVLGLIDRIEVVSTNTQDPEDSIRVQNPLGKIPALILEDGTVLYDSRVILEYLDHLAGGGKIIPAEADRRYPALVLQALGDGVADAALLQVYEQRWREAPVRSEEWVAHQAGKVSRGLEGLEATDLSGDTHVGHIATACALGYLDLRFAGFWRERHGQLAAWLDDFSARTPAYAMTAPHG